MKKDTKILITTLVVLLILVIALIMGVIKIIFTVMGAACGNDIQREIPSPNGEKVAYVFLRSCGATTVFSPQLSILDKGDDLENEGGNTFKSDKSFTIEWVDKKSLKVVYPSSSKPFEMDKRVNGVSIEYYEE
ncbi:hypothetical protein QE429_000868 [Bacillus sp. SORGH_AS 510]|uniref:hypothetical protein n=1 Tax=Bacillus sp. SORGH_AS_0510 TaxID=3041771 RepID=UPI002784661C|nr:hypothetical protein [Bacillus sp. SORGH_AS_0510]MDQ1144041.1 hypothetical protein [Bacillus sp. SORGH_AS_0510]